MHRGPRTLLHSGWLSLQTWVICVPPQFLHYFPEKARGYKNIRASLLYLEEQELLVFILLSFYITVFTEVALRSSLLGKILINGPVGLRVFPHLVGPNSNLGVTFKFFQSILMTTVLFTLCLGVLGGVTVFHLRNFCGW